MEKIKVILDTDIGDDIDDAFALAILLNSPEIDLLGVTTVFRNAQKRAKMAKRLITLYGKQVKTYAGCDVPFIQNVGDLLSDEIKNREKLDEYGKYLIPQWFDEMQDEIVEKTHAVDFIIEQVHKYPHEVCLFGIGPLTNIAMAIRKDPSIVPLIKEIRIMGGQIDLTEPVEWNILCDPEAARIVYEADLRLVAIGFNVTERCKLDKTKMDAIKDASQNAVSLLYKMMMKWFEHYHATTPMMHDPLAVSTSMIDCVTFKDMYIKVDLNENRAATMPVETGKHLISVAVDVDLDKFFKFFMERVFNK